MLFPGALCTVVQPLMTGNLQKWSRLEGLEVIGLRMMIWSDGNHRLHRDCTLCIFVFFCLWSVPVNFRKKLNETAILLINKKYSKNTTSNVPSFIFLARRNPTMGNPQVKRKK